MRPIFGLVMLAIAGVGIGTAQQSSIKDIGPVTVIDSTKKEGVLKKCSITLGTRRYNLPETKGEKGEKGEKIDPAKAGQDYVEFREDNSTNLVEGILTLVPITSVRQLEYDLENRSVQLTLVQADGKDAKIKGTTKFVNINNFTVEGAIDLGEIGTANVKYQGGNINAKPAIRKFVLPFKDPAPPTTGMSYQLTGIDADKSVHTVHDLKALYRSGGVDKLSSTLWFKETAKIPIAKIKHMSQPDEGTDYVMTLIDDKQLPPLALQKSGFPEDGSAAQLVGLVGKVDAGYKLFPMHTFSELRLKKE